MWESDTDVVTRTATGDDQIQSSREKALFIRLSVFNRPIISALLFKTRFPAFGEILFISGSKKG
ncbi:hypothetical protein DWY58_07200 [Bacteroides stercoris]|uniref:Uncharacterized protein n=1 Tax=Bacteroides stercoris TaxID=46506 RepID=A0A412E752_BACSE|nr:hypothetical protein DWY58_07200 [Bacteroides stercoris]